MNLLPFHRFEITSPLNRQDAVRVLASNTEKEKWFRFSWPTSANDNRFEGDVYADRFRIRRIIGYRNSFLPVVEGRIEEDGGRRSRVIITMRPFVFTIVFVALWCTLAGASLIGAGELWPLSVALLLFMYLLTMGAFWFEANKQERVLRQIFQAV